MRISIQPRVIGEREGKEARRKGDRHCHPFFYNRGVCTPEHLFGCTRRRHIDETRKIFLYQHRFPSTPQNVSSLSS